MRLPGFLKAREMVTVTGVLAFAAVVGFVDPNFIAPSNLARVLNSTVILALLTAGVAVVIITKNIDVSVGSTLALTAIVGASMMRSGAPIPVVIVVTVLLGGVLGAINGLGVVYGHVPSIVMTLGTLGLYRGISFLITDGYSIESIPSSYKAVAKAEFLGLPILVWLTVGMLIGFGLILSRARIGRNVYATGDNIEGARLIGVRVPTITISAFALSGMLAAMGGLVFLAQIGSISNQAGMGIEMRAIAAAVIGGVALTGGAGSVYGAGIGALFISLVTSSMSFLSVPGYWTDGVIGAVLLLALFTDARVRAALEVRRVDNRYRVHAVASAPQSGTDHTAREDAR
jgi:AI-2 transport system permease protein